MDTTVMEANIHYPTDTGLLADGVRVKSPGEVSRDPQVKANNYLLTVDHSSRGPISLVATPVQFNHTPFKIGSAAPKLGQHTGEILLSIGYDWAQIQQMKDEMVII